MYRLSCFVLLSTSVFVSVGPAEERPNVLLVMANDLGCADIGCLGSEIEAFWMAF